MSERQGKASHLVRVRVGVRVRVRVGVRVRVRLRIRVRVRVRVRVRNRVGVRVGRPRTGEAFAPRHPTDRQGSR